MDVHSLPKYRGLVESQKMWREPNEVGKTPRFRIRDYIVMFLLFVICCPAWPPTLYRIWKHHQIKMQQELARGKQTDQDLANHFGN